MADKQDFDLDKLKELIALMDQHGLTEISLSRGDEQWKLKRGSQEVMQLVPGTGPAPVTSPVSDDTPEQAPESTLPTINSPTVGTFYCSPSPDDPSFIKIGDTVSHDTIVCIVEAMKVFNQIPAELSGTIVEALVENGDPVEFGQPLFRIQPS